MGKESKQAIVLLVIVLAAVVLIDIGNSQLSGKLVDRRNAAGEEIVRDGETEDLDSSAYSTTIGGGSEQPLRTQPPIAERICELQDMTAYVSKHLPPNQQITSISNVDDLKKRLFVVHTWDTTQPNAFSFYVFDLNQDLIFSGDDRLHYIGTSPQRVRPHPYSYFEITNDARGSEKLFWEKETATTDEVWSCDLPQCTYPNRVAVTDAQTNALVQIIPSLTYNRLFMASVDVGMKTTIIRSCSLTPAADGCDQTEDKYITHATSTVLWATEGIRDQGIMMTDSGGGQYLNTHFFNIHTKKIVQLPVGILRGAAGNFLGSNIPNMIFLIRNYNLVTELVFLDLVNLQTTTFDRLPNYINAFLINTYRGKTYTVYQSTGKLDYWRKDVDQQPKLILEDKNIKVSPLMQLANGNIIGATATGIVSFTCTP